MTRLLPLLFASVASSLATAGGVQSRAQDPGPTFTRTTLSPAEGVPSSSVKALCFDADGFLLVGSTAGLARYDGSRFEEFLASETPGHSGDRVQALLTDRSGITWVGVDEFSPSRMERGQFQPACSPEIVRSVHQIHETRSGDLWFAGNRLAFQSDGRIQQVEPVGGDRTLAPLRITEDGDGQIWVATADGVFRGGKAGFELVDERPSVSILTGFDGAVWSQLRHGDLVPLTGNSKRTVQFGEIKLNCVLSRGTDRSLVGTTGGLYHMRPAGPGRTELLFELIQPPVKEPGTSRWVNCLLAAGGADVWMGTEFHGIDYLQRRYVTLLPLVPGNDPTASARLTSLENVLPLPSGGAIVHEGKQENPTLLGADASTSLLDAPGTDYAGIHFVASHKGQALLSTTGGLARLVGDRVVPDPVWTGSGGPIVSLPDGEVWMCLGNRIHRIEGPAGPVERGDGIPLPQRKMNALVFHQGSIVGANQGRLLRLDTEEQRWHAIADLGPAYGRALRVGQEGELWITTYGNGLFRLSADGKLDHWSRKDGMPDPFLAWIGPVDEHGQLWLHSNSGVLRLKVASLDAYASGEVEAIESSTFSAPETNGPGGAELEGGRFALPTLEGLAIFDRSAVAPPSISPAVRLLYAHVDGAPVDQAAAPTGRATLEFDFAAPIYPTDDGARFQHRLIGLDETWHEAGAERKARFPELPAGDYVFEVRTRIPTGSWSEPMRSDSITIEPYWHQRGWIRLVLLAGIFGLTWGVVVLRTRSLARTNRALQFEIDQRELAESKLRSSEVRYLHLFHTAPSAVLSWSPSGELLDRNVRASELFQIPDGEAAGLLPWELFEDASLGRSLFETVVQSQRDLSTVASAVTSDGALRRCRWHFAPTRDARGELASVIALVIDLSRRDQDAKSMAELRKSLVRAEESERSRIARELHDDLSQRLAALALEARMADDGMLDPSELEASPMRSFQSEIESIARDVHGISRQLHPAIVDDLGYLAALRSECSRRSRLGPLSVLLDVESGVEDPPRETALALFRIAQEAMRNAERHADAAGLWVSVTADQWGLEMEIRDDGAGFNEDAVCIGGIGLKSMRERARLVGGDIEIETEPGAGTCVTVRVPHHAGKQATDG